ncbi:MAG: ABC transporter permease [Eubacterium sp.]|nr:ABC transporter permease [Eubacterium sp.]
MEQSIGTNRTGRLGQIKIYVGKFYRLFMNEKNWKLFIFAGIVAGLIALVLGDDMFVVKEATRTDFFAIICACLWIGIFNSIQQICRERSIIKREHRTGMHITSYVSAHMIFQLIVCAIQALIMTAIYAAATSFPSAGLITGSFVVDFYITMLLVIYSSDVLGLAISAIVKSTTAAMTVMPFILIVQLIFSGTIFPLTGAAKTVSDFTIAKWGQRVLCIEANLNELPSELLDQEIKMFNEQEDIANIRDALSEEDVAAFDEAMYDKLQNYLHDYTYRKIYRYEPDLVLKRWWNLIMFTFIYGLICVLSLELIDRDKR